MYECITVADYVTIRYPQDASDNIDYRILWDLQNFLGLLMAHIAE